MDPPAVPPDFQISAAILASFRSTVRSDMSRDGDIIVARTVEPVAVAGRIVIDEGASVYGELSAIALGEGDDPATMTLLIGSDDPEAASEQATEKAEDYTSHPDNTETADPLDPGADPLATLHLDEVLKAQPGEDEVIVPADGFHAIELPAGQQLVVRIEESELPVLAAVE